ncbi:MAG: cupin domain-containing protein [Bacteroidota bacterium]
MQRRKFLTVSSLALAMGTVSEEGKAESNLTNSFIVKAKEARFGIHTPFMGINPNDVKISGKDTNGQLAVFEYIGNQKVGPSLHIHFDQDEIFTVVEGEYLFQVGDKKDILNVGDTIFLPRQVPHTWIQLSNLGKLIYFLQPAGKMEEFFMTMSNLKGKPSTEEIDKIHAAHGLKVVGPPLSLK